MSTKRNDYSEKEILQMIDTHDVSRAIELGNADAQRLASKLINQRLRTRAVAPGTEALTQKISHLETANDKLREEVSRQKQKNERLTTDLQHQAGDKNYTIKELRRELQVLNDRK